MPGNTILLLPDVPRFTMVDVTDHFISTSGLKRENIIGKGFFDIFNADPEIADHTGADNFLSSLTRCVETGQKQIHLSKNFRIFNDTGLSEKTWDVQNIPVPGEDGNIEFIIFSSDNASVASKLNKREEDIRGIEKAYHIFMNAPVIIGILSGREYKIELANEGLLEVWGRTADVIGKPLIEAIPELSDQGFIALLDEVCSTGKPFYAYEFPITLNRHGKEEVLYFDFVYKPIYDNGMNERASGIISVGHDVTAQVLARRAIEENDIKYRKLFDSMDQGFCILEIIFDDEKKPVDYRFLEANPMFEKQTGLVNAVGKTALELVPNLEPRWPQFYGKVAETGESLRFTEGSEAMGRWFDVYAFPIGNDTSRKVALIFTDVTEKRKGEEALLQSERNLRNTILQAPVAMAILKGSQFVVEIANDKMYELWGRGKEELLGKSIFIGLPEVRNQGYEELLNKVYTTGETFSALGIPVTLPREGRIETVYINLLYTAFREGDGTISGIMAVATDVTEQVIARQKIEEIVHARTQELARMNDALVHSNEELKRSNVNLEEFAYAASHDLKEPMRKIQLFSDRLKDSLRDKLSGTEKNYFERILQANLRMNTLIDDLLMYSQVSRGAELEEFVDLNQKVKNVLEDLELAVEEKKAKITIGPLPTIRGHRRQLQQLFQNLIGNALKYVSNDRPPVIHIHSRKANLDDEQIPARLKPGNYYLIEVRDNGIGFEAEHSERIFNIFTRLHGNAEYKGTGVGLSIVRKVVENHGGYIWAESKPGEGSNFKIVLPSDHGIQQVSGSLS